MLCCLKSIRLIIPFLSINHCLPCCVCQANAGYKEKRAIVDGMKIELQQKIAQYSKFAEIGGAITYNLLNPRQKCPCDFARSDKSSPISLLT